MSNASKSVHQEVQIQNNQILNVNVYKNYLGVHFCNTFAIRLPNMFWMRCHGHVHPHSLTVLTEHQDSHLSLIRISPRRNIVKDPLVTFPPVYSFTCLSCWNSIHIPSQMLPCHLLMHLWDVSFGYLGFLMSWHRYLKVYCEGKFLLYFVITAHHTIKFQTLGFYCCNYTVNILQLVVGSVLRVHKLILH